MKPQVLVVLVARDQADAGLVRDSLNVGLIGRDVLRAVINVERSEAAWGCAGDAIFRNETDAKAWRDQIVAMWTGGALADRILAGSKLSFHLCPHLDGESSFHCRDDARATYAERIKV
jgi:hypothetical protein